MLPNTSLGVNILLMFGGLDLSLKEFEEKEFNSRAVMVLCWFQESEH